MKSKANIQTEVDAAYLYRILSENEKDPQVAEIFRKMAEIEMSHAVQEGCVHLRLDVGF